MISSRSAPGARRRSRTGSAPTSKSSSPLSQRTAVAAQGMPAMVLPARRRVWGSMCCRAASGRSASGKCLTLSPGKRLALAGMRLFRSLMAREWRLRMKHGLELWFVVLHPHPQCGKILAPTIRDPEGREQRGEAAAAVPIRIPAVRDRSIPLPSSGGGPR